VWSVETKLPTETLVQCANIVDLLDEDEARWLGAQCCERFKQDKDSRAEWERRMGRAMELALQVAQKKTFPWENAANVKFPLITIAALQFHSRAYPALIDGPLPVAAKSVVPGDKEAEARALRIQAHMSYQILEEMLDWEEETDKGLLIQAIMGCVFKKTWFDPVLGINRSICVNPRDLYINYWATSIEDAQRITHVIYLSRNGVKEQQLLGNYAEFTNGTEQPAHPSLRDGNGVDKRQGTNPPPVDSDTPYEILEQCLFLDLDGDDYREPYVATVRHDTKQLLRLAPLYTRRDITWTSPPANSRVKPRILRIAPCGLYTKYTFIPSPDGGIYDLGLGALLGPVSEVIDSAINQMLDAGTLATAGGGFLGKGARMKKGDIHISPGKWVTLDCLGSEMKDNVIPLPVPQPSEALYKLITLLIEYAQNLVGATDALLGNNPGQNTPAATQTSMVEQGMTTFNGIYKRTHKGMGREFRKLYRLNTNFLADGRTKFYDTKGSSAEIFGADYTSQGLNLVRPAANPFYMSPMQRLQQATAIEQAAHSGPGWDIYEADMNFLRALKVEEPTRFRIDPQLLLDAQKSGDMSKVPAGAQPMPNPQMIVAQSKQGMVQVKQQELQLKAKMQEAELQMEAAKLQYEIALLSAQAANQMAQAKGVDQGHAIALLEAQIGAKNAHLDHILKSIEVVHSMIQTQAEGEENDAQREHERSMASMEAKRGNQASAGSRA
jgi:chaperonin GroES